MAAFRAIIVALFFAVFMYVTHQMVRYADLSVGQTLFIVGFLGILFGIVISMPLFFWSRSESRSEPKPWRDPYFSAAHFSMAYISFLLTFIILRDIAGFVLNYTNPEFVGAQLYGTQATGMLLVIPLILLLLGTLVVRLGVKVIKVEIPFKNLPEGLNGLRLLHITDLHVAPGLPIPFVQKLVDKTNSLNADLVIFTGDILDDHAGRHIPEFDILKKIQSKFGTYYVPGNHEYYWNIESSLAAFRGIGYHVLLNQTETLQVNGSALQISGIADPAARQFGHEPADLEKLVSQQKAEAFKIFLAHQPAIADKACDKGFDLQLSGHTHGGQFFPWNFLIVFFQRYPKGLYSLKNMRLYVNQGTGYWGPSLRLGTFCELTEITLKKA
ncbi:metallophosphoesterase [Bdellovibrio sp. SKB1291214]|uniref:metallophosphoesterase n=1 Tax=Bdellovibrio sp. SKB1291214 TaxID=1732569 RepID=UPI000B519C22|nr:metallophosphoesterase [Bdellovibrio sp. SKB1291214]UYL10135.1 metallophosphoesterase [Bdellovibrio sp. SKB1291214]